jgi:hypothetical protein
MRKGLAATEASVFSNLCKDGGLKNTRRKSKSGLASWDMARWRFADGGNPFKPISDGGFRFGEKSFGFIFGSNRSPLCETKTVQLQLEWLTQAWKQPFSHRYRFFPGQLPAESGESF